MTTNKMHEFDLAICAREESQHYQYTTKCAASETNFDWLALHADDYKYEDGALVFWCTGQWRVMMPVTEGQY